MKTMKRLSVFAVITAITVIAAGFLNENKNKASVNNSKTLSSTLQSNGKQLFDTKCNICHAVKESPDKMTAPPFINIKKKYMAVYKSKDKFMEGIIDFTANPQESKVLMPGAFKQFKLMPKMGYDKEDLKIIAGYIYEADFPKPQWFKK